MDEAQRIAYGRLRLLPKDFYNLTPLEFRFAIEGYNKEHEEIMQSQMEAARMVASSCLWPHMKPGSSKDPKRLFPFPWDDKKKSKYKGWTPERKKAVERFIKDKWQEK